MIGLMSSLTRKTRCCETQLVYDRKYFITKLAAAICIHTDNAMIRISQTKILNLHLFVPVTYGEKIMINAPLPFKADLNKRKEIV